MSNLNNFLHYNHRLLNMRVVKKHATVPLRFMVSRYFYSVSNNPSELINLYAKLFFCTNFFQVLDNWNITTVWITCLTLGHIHISSMISSRSKKFEEFDDTKNFPG